MKYYLFKSNPCKSNNQRQVIQNIIRFDNFLNTIEIKWLTSPAFRKKKTENKEYHNFFLYFFIARVRWNYNSYSTGQWFDIPKLQSRSSELLWFLEEIAAFVCTQKDPYKQISQFYGKPQPTVDWSYKM